MATIGIDFDETLYPFDSEIRESFFELAIEREDKSILRGAYSNNQEWRNLVDHDQDIAFEAIERVHERAKEQVPFPHSVRVVNRLAEKHKIIYIGSRFEKHRANTEDWLCDNGFPDGGLICVPPTESKLFYVLDCQYLIDDRPKTLIEFIHDDYHYEYWDVAPRKAFGLWRSYNQNLTDIKNIYLAPTWLGISYYLERKGII